MKQLTELKKQYKLLGKEIKKLEEKPKIKTVRDLEEGDKFYWIDGVSNIVHDKACEWVLYDFENAKRFLTKPEAQRRALRDRIECELDCDSRISLSNAMNWGKRYYISYFETIGKKLHLGDSSLNLISGLFGAVNFPTKESLIESINEVKEDANGKSFTIRELLNQYFEVKEFEVV